MKKISVLMVTYGHEDYIHDTITSIFQQDYQGPIELVIGNDCSPDRTDSIIKNLIAQAPKNINVIYKKWARNLGGVANFNKCLELCSSDFICVCDGDDIALPDRVSSLVEHHNLHNKSLYISNADEMYQDGNLTGKKRYYIDFDLSKISIADLYSAKVPIFGASYAFTRDIIDHYGLIDEDYVTKNNVDQILFWRAYAKRGVHYIHQPLLQYRTHINGTSIQRCRNDAIQNHNNFKAMILTLAISNNTIGNLVYVLDTILLEKRDKNISTLLGKIKKEITLQTELKNQMLSEDIDGIISNDIYLKKIISGMISQDQSTIFDIHSFIDLAYLTLTQRTPTSEESLKIAMNFTNDTISVSDISTLIKSIKKHIKIPPDFNKKKQKIDYFSIEDFRRMDRYMMINEVFFYFLDVLPSEEVAEALAFKIRSKELTKLQTLIVIAEFCGKTLLSYNISNFLPMAYTKIKHYNKIEKIKKELIALT